MQIENVWQSITGEEMRSRQFPGMERALSYSLRLYGLGVTSACIARRWSSEHVSDAWDRDGVPL
jgi:hypothetical protein